MKRKKIIIIVGFLLIILIAFLGLAFAFNIPIFTGLGGKVTTEVENLKLEFNDSSNLNATDIYPLWTSTKTFSITNTGTSEVTYDLIWKNLTNKFIKKDELVYSATCTGVGCVAFSEREMPESGKNIKINSMIHISSGVTHTYTFTFNYKELTSIQNLNNDKEVLGKIGIISTNPKDNFDKTDYDTLSDYSEVSGDYHYKTMILNKNSYYRIKITRNNSLLSNSAHEIRISTSNDFINNSVLALSSSSIETEESVIQSDNSGLLYIGYYGTTQEELTNLMNNCNVEIYKQDGNENYFYDETLNKNFSSTNYFNEDTYRDLSLYTNTYSNTYNYVIISMDSNVYYKQNAYKDYGYNANEIGSVRFSYHPSFGENYVSLSSSTLAFNNYRSTYFMPWILGSNYKTFSLGYAVNDTPTQEEYDNLWNNMEFLLQKELNYGKVLHSPEISSNTSSLSYKIINDNFVKDLNVDLLKNPVSDTSYNSLGDTTSLTSDPLIVGKDYSSREFGLYKAIGNDGYYTYYFRGNVQNNYVSFAGRLWKILRINEDGSIRIISNSAPISSSYNVTNSIINPDYETSEMKTNIESWYDNNLNIYDSYINYSRFCNDKSGNFYNRWSSGKATLNCPSGSNEIISKIGLISADELVYSGTSFTKQSSNEMLRNLYNTFTLTSYGNGFGMSLVLPNSNVSGNYIRIIYPVNYNSVRNAFPVISLNKDVVVSSGVGTQNSPYVINTSNTPTN